MNDKIKYWVDLSEYDIETAEAMLQTKRFLYVGFMCHQSIEKILKAVFQTRKEETPPFSHSLSYLAKKAELFEELNEDQMYIIDILEPLNIEARYPTQKERLLKSLSEEKCKAILENTKKLQKWLIKKL